MTTPPGETGGCLCGRIRYRIDGPLPRVVHCHCTMCRRASGALVVTFAALSAGAFSWTRGEPAEYRSSSHAVRRFCSTCGSPLTFRDERDPDVLDVNLGTLDHPERYPAQQHIYTDTRVPWLTVDPDLPSRADPD